MKKILFITSLILITFSACEKPTQTDLTINFTQTVDGSELTTNSMVYTNSAGENYDVKTLKYLISDITLHSDDGNTLLLDEVHFINIFDESTFSFTYDNVPNNNYYAISYTMGLDTAKNISNLYVNENYHAAMAWPDMMGGALPRM